MTESDQHSSLLQYVINPGRKIVMMLASDGCHSPQHNDTQHSNIQHNDIQHYEIQHNDTQHNEQMKRDTQHTHSQYNGPVLLGCALIMSSVMYAVCHCAECRGTLRLIGERK